MPRETNYLLPESSDDILSIPNIEKEVEREVARLTLELIQDIREVFNSGVTYDTIEYIEDELKPVVSIDRLLTDIADLVSRKIKNILNQENYLSYFNLFTVTEYDTSGKAKVEINIPVTGIGISALSISNVRLVSK